MAFNLKKVLRALLFSTNQALSVKDIQTAFTRFHEQATLPLVEGDESAPDEAAEAAPLSPDAPPAGGAEGIPASPFSEAAEQAAEAVNPLALATEDPELYLDVPSLITATQIREAMDEIAAELKLADNGLMLIDGSGGYQLVTEPRYARWLRILRNEPPPVKLTQSALETLAVISYRQPVTRTEIEHIRGVSAEAGVNKLLERELIYIVGRADLPGRPLQYGTTDKFLEFVGIKSLDELPASDVLTNRQIDEWLQKTTNTKPPSDAEMGLPLENGEGATPNLDNVEAGSTESADEAAKAKPEAAPEPPPEPDVSESEAPAAPSSEPEPPAASPEGESLSEPPQP